MRDLGTTHAIQEQLLRTYELWRRTREERERVKKGAEQENDFTK